MRIQSQVITVPLSGTVSGILELVGAKVAGIIAPATTSCQAFMQGFTSATSAGFVRMSKTDGSSDWAWNLGVGSKCVSLEQVISFPYLRIELGVEQTAVRSFTVITKL